MPVSTPAALRTRVATSGAKGGPTSQTVGVLGPLASLPGQRAWQNELWQTLRLLSSYARLYRYRSRTYLFERAPWLSRLLPFGMSAGLLLACTALSPSDSGGDMTPSLSPLAPDLSKTKRSLPPRSTPWDYVLPVDHGVRSDQSGTGSFRAPRFHGEHNGIDLLAPVGTPTFAACSGRAISSASPSFGRWVQVVCPVPRDLAPNGGPEPWASFFYAHLDSTTLPHGKWVTIERGTEIGTVGKTGNARGSEIQPHLHLELIVQQSLRHAMDERHLGSDQSGVPAADLFAERISTICLDPMGFHPKSRLLTRARRVDPFVALTCLSQAKPEFRRAPDPIGFASMEWSRFYVAKRFNVNDGPDDRTN